MATKQPTGTNKVTDIGTARKQAHPGRGSSYTGRYSPDSFIIPGQDNNGNSIRLFCRIMPLLSRSLDIIHGSGKFPFKSKGDVMRWCVKRGVEVLEEMEPMPGSVTAQVDAMIYALQGEQAAHQFLTLFNVMGATVGEHIQAQALGEARRVISDMIRMIKAIDNEYWRGRYLEELDKRFGYLLKGDIVAGAGLGQHEDHGPDRGSNAGVDEGDGEGDD